MNVSSGADSEPPGAVLGFGLDTAAAGGGPWLQRQKNAGGVSVQTRLMNSEAHPAPPPPTAVGARVRLPALTAKGPRRRGNMARLSLSEPSLFPHSDSVLLGGRSAVRRPALLHKRAAVSSSTSFLKPSPLIPNPPPPPLSQDPLHATASARPIYLHFSQSIQPSLKPRVARRHSHNPTSELRPQVSPLAEPLSVVGKTCLPMCSPRPGPTLVPGAPRPHIHVFLPSEAEGEDSESVDEGFMDELDIKMSSLKLQQGAPQTVAVHCNKKKLLSSAQ